jgi:hypothetical protein
VLVPTSMVLLAILAPTTVSEGSRKVVRRSLAGIWEIPLDYTLPEGQVSDYSAPKRERLLATCWLSSPLGSRLEEQHSRLRSLLYATAPSRRTCSTNKLAEHEEKNKVGSEWIGCLAVRKGRATIFLTPVHEGQISRLGCCGPLVGAVRRFPPGLVPHPVLRGPFGV